MNPNMPWCKAEQITLFISYKNHVFWLSLEKEKTTLDKMFLNLMQIRARCSHKQGSYREKKGNLTRA